MNNRNEYYNENIDFYIEKPDEWAFFPTSWVVNIKNKAVLSNEDIAHIMQQANVPFVYMQKPLARDDIAYPTAQATCRYISTPSTEARLRLERLQIQTLQNSFRDFQLIESSTEKPISGHPANYYKAAFSVQNEDGDTFNCITEAWTVFSNNIAYSLGLSGSAEDRGAYEKDLEQILKSIKISETASA